MVRARAARLDRVGRGPRRRAGREGRGLPEQRHQQPGLPGRGRLTTRSRRSSTTWRGTSTIPRPGSAPGSGPSSARSPTRVRPISVRRRGQRVDLRIDALGSGSDFTPFLQHVGVATLKPRLRWRGRRRIYHSIYDDFKWYTRFDDTSFVYGRALAQTAGTAVMRLADAEVVPYQFTAFGETVGRYVKEVQKLLQEKQDTVRERNRQLDEGVFAATADPREPSVPPAARAAAVSELRAARQRGRRPQSGGGALRTGLRESPGERRGRARQAGGAGVERHAAPERAGAHGARRVCHGDPGTATRSTRPGSTPATG